MKSPCTTTREEPLLAATREKPTQQQRPSTAKTNKPESHLPMQGTWVQSLVGEQGSHMQLSLQATTREAYTPHWRPSRAQNF